jgi:hypothetical protein
MRPAPVAGAVLACVLAFAAGRGLLARDRAPGELERTAAPAEDTRSPATVALANGLAEERAAREALALEVARLSAELDALRAGTELPALGPAGGEEASEDEATPERVGGAAGELWFDEGRLLAGGLRPADAEALRELYEEIQLERLYTRDTAIREGWVGPRLRQEFRALDQRIEAVREEWGEDAYDWFLYAADRTNRVGIESVLGGSPASEAGVRPGDVVVSYAGRRIYTPAELRRATSEGRLGEVVTLELLSNGRMRQVDVQRGPLGVRLDARTDAPR